MDLIGIDVGFSVTRRSSGLARLIDGELRLGRATTAWAERREILGEPTRADVIAIDAPVLSTMHFEPRGCERLLTLGQFQRRCKPGLSHVPGTGRRLRQAGHDTAVQFMAYASGSLERGGFPRVISKSNIIEAFPNAFLGVTVHEDRFATMPKLRRGRKFDWLYDQWIDQGTFVELARGLDAGSDLVEAISNCTDHDERAALVCLLTAAEVARGRYTAVGNMDDGYIFLPRQGLWAPWARDELEKQSARCDSIEFWLDGKRIHG